jgi:hypothetical protein
MDAARRQKNQPVLTISTMAKRRSPSSIASAIQVEMNISMSIRHGVLVPWFSAVAKEHKRFARFEVLVSVAAKFEPGERFAPEFY